MPHQSATKVNLTCCHNHVITFFQIGESIQSHNSTESEINESTIYFYSLVFQQTGPIDVIDGVSFKYPLF